MRLTSTLLPALAAAAAFVLPQVASAHGWGHDYDRRAFEYRHEGYRAPFRLFGDGYGPGPVFRGSRPFHRFERYPVLRFRRW